MQKRNQKTKSVGNGEGSLYYSDTLQCWIFQYMYNGSRKTMKQKKKETIKEFKARVTDIKNKINIGAYIENSQESIVTLAKHYIEQKHIDGTTSDRSYRRELETLAQIQDTCSLFCDIPIQKVNIHHIENAKKDIKKYSNGVIDKIWTMLNKTFLLACSPSRRILIYNIMQDETLKKPISNKKTKKVKPLNDKEYEKLLHVLNNEERNHKYRNIIKMQLISGMRIGEVLARSKDDYDEKNKTFNVYNTLTQDNNYQVVWSNHTKTYNKKTQIDEGQRFLPLDNPLFAELIDMIKEEHDRTIISIKNIHNVLFWDYVKDNFVTPSAINSWLIRLNTKYKICKDSLTTHRLRHFALTHWRDLGIPLEAIQYLAGHVEGSCITKDVYIDTSLDFVQKVLNKIS